MRGYNDDIRNQEIVTIGNQIYTTVTYFKRNWKSFNTFIPAFTLRIAAGLIISWSLYIQPNLSSSSIKGLSALFCVGAIFGALITALIFLQIQKKFFNYASGFLTIAHGIILLTAYDKNLYILVIGNLLSGISYGIISISSIIHASELSSNSMRGRNIVLLEIAITAGILIGLQISVKTIKTSLNNNEWFWISNGIVLIICGILSIIGTYIFLIESQAFWIYKGDNVKARESMLKARNEIYETFEIADNLQTMNAFVNYGIEDIYKCLPLIYFNKEKYLKFAKICLFKIAYAFGSGLSINLFLITYETWLIGSPDGISLYILPRILIEIAVIILIDRYGRRWFLIISAIGCGLVLIVINVVLMSSLHLSEEILYTIAVLTILYQILIGLGLSNVPVVLMAEVFDFYSKPFFNYLIFVLENSCHIIIVLYLNRQYFNVTAYIFITAALQLFTGFICWYCTKETTKFNILNCCKLF